MLTVEDLSVPEIISEPQEVIRTPLVEVSKGIYAKEEFLQPTGSIKYRMAKYILNKAEEEGLLRPGQFIVEATSGNTGIAFAMLAAERGYKMIVVMPSNMSEERKEIIRSFGAHIIEVAPNDFEGACERRNELVELIGAFTPNQFGNKDNVECHELTTAREIVQQVREINESLQIAAFVAGTGTGGTLMGVRKGLLTHFPDIQIVAVEPTESAVMSGGKAGEHLIQGIGDGFIPPLVNMKNVDKVIAVSSADAIRRTKALIANGVPAGISSGANILAAERYQQEFGERVRGIIVTVLPDSQNRYTSMLSL